MPDTFDRLKTALADRYAIERELGSGGMATVYLAEDLKHHRKVVKVLRPELAAVIGAERWVATRRGQWWGRWGKHTSSRIVRSGCKRVPHFERRQSHDDDHGNRRSRGMRNQPGVVATGRVTQ